MVKNIKGRSLIRKWLKQYGEHITGESLTVPGEAYTIQQLFDRAQAGVPLDVSVNLRQGYYSDDADFDTFAPEADFDFADAQEAIRQSQEVISEAKEALSKKGSKAKNMTKDGQSPIEEEDKAKEPIKGENTP